jgi:hypothetical protein
MAFAGKCWAIATPICGRTAIATTALLTDKPLPALMMDCRDAR